MKSYVFAINVGQLGHKSDSGELIPQYKTNRVILGKDGKTLVEELGPIDVSFANVPSQELLDLIRKE